MKVRCGLSILALLLVATAFSPGLQFGSGINSKGSMAPAPPRRAPATRTLTGEILNQNDDPLASAVVYLKDTRTNAIRTYISNRDGSYQFAGLDRNQDYELHAEYKGSRSSSKTLSAFDSRTNPSINLHVEVKKAGK